MENVGSLLAHYLFIGYVIMWPFKKNITEWENKKQYNKLLLQIWKTVCFKYWEDEGIHPTSIKTALLAEELLQHIPLSCLPRCIVCGGEKDIVFEWEKHKIHYGLNIDNGLLNFIKYPYNKKGIVHVNDIPYNSGPIPNEILKHLDFIKDK